MTISYIPGVAPEVGLVKVEAPEILDVFSSPDLYEYIVVTGKVSGGLLKVEKYFIADLFNVENKFWLADEVLYVSPIFFGLTEFTDSIITLSIKLKRLADWVLIQNCYFIDTSYRCKLATLLDGIIIDSKAPGSEGLSTMAHMLHYALFNGGNCGCNCEEMESVFLELKRILANVDPKITNACGC